MGAATREQMEPSTGLEAGVEDGQGWPPGNLSHSLLPIFHVRGTCFRKKPKKRKASQDLEKVLGDSTLVFRCRRFK